MDTPKQKTMKFKERFSQVQATLKAPKGQRNNFGKYNYRSCEDIVEAVKPLLSTGGMYLTISDDIVVVGDRTFVKATATVQDCKSEEHEGTIAFAELALEQKGMDAAQLTGAASSYARKYALNGLFAIDDTKDADTDQYTEKTKRAPAKPRAATKSKGLTAEQMNQAVDYIEKMGEKGQQGLDAIVGKYGNEITAAQLKKLKAAVK